MQEKKGPTKIVKGGFRASLALIISIIALVLSIISYTRDRNQAELNAEIKELWKKIEILKQETSERVKKMRQETAAALEKLGIDMKKDEQKTEDSKSQ